MTTTTPEPETTALEFEQLSSAQLALSRLLSSRETRFQTRLLETEFTGQLTLSPTSELPTYQLSLELNGEPYTAFVGQQILDYLLPEKLDHNAIEKLPDDLTNAALLHSLSPVLQQLSAITGFTTTFQGISKSEATELPLVVLELESSGLSSHLYLQVNHSLLQLLQQLPTHQIQQLPDIPFWATLELGQTQLTGAELKELDCGDIVFLDHYVTGQQVIVRINQRIAFQAETSGSQITVSQRLQNMDGHDEETLEQEGHEPEQEEAMAESAVDMNDLPVNLTFEVGQQEMTAAELQQLQPGYVFDLDRDIQHPVKVRANGKLIGECQLVQVENRLGARITSLHK